MSGKIISRVREREARAADFRLKALLSEVEDPRFIAAVERLKAYIEENYGRLLPDGRRRQWWQFWR